MLLLLDSGWYLACSVIYINLLQSNVILVLSPCWCHSRTRRRGGERTDTEKEREITIAKIRMGICALSSTSGGKKKRERIGIEPAKVPTGYSSTKVDNSHCIKNLHISSNNLKPFPTYWLYKKATVWWRNFLMITLVWQISFFQSTLFLVSFLINLFCCPSRCLLTPNKCMKGKKLPVTH